MQKVSKEWFTMPLATPVPTHLGDELRRRIFFISDDIDDFELSFDGNSINAVKVKPAHAGVTQSEIQEKIDMVVSTEILGLKTPSANIRWNSRTAAKQVTDVYPDMKKLGLAFETGEGQVGFKEPILSLMDYLDDRLKRIALGFPNAREYRYPTLIPSEVLEVSGYFHSFPQFMMFVTHLHNDIDVYKSFLDDYEVDGKLPDSLFSQCCNHDYCLPPTMCYHVFNQLRDQELDDNMVATTVGKSFRFESKYHEGLARLWDFTIREVVFLGLREFVVECRERFMAEVFELIDELGLPGHCEVANDPFFANSDAADKISTQLMMEMKYELRLNITPDTTIAAGSFNFHDRFFASNFDINDGVKDRPLYSGCVGFGLERLTYCFLCQHGLDEANWPNIVLTD